MDTRPDSDLAERGLSAAEVAQRVRLGKTNAVRERTSRSYLGILRENVLTLFNLILAVLVTVVLVAGSPRDALFGLVMVFNAVIGVMQEVRAKRTLDRLTLLSAPRARVVRDGAEREVTPDEVVLDDVCALRAGDQVLVDGVVLRADELEVDESLLSGESVPVRKRAGDEVLSGSFVVAGAGHARATRVGADAYARTLTAEARRFTLTRSELRTGIDGVLKVVLWAMLPIGALTVAAQLARAAGWRSAAISTAAALSGMVPQGLVLLTSITFAASVIVLGRRHVLVQELAAVEVLARVDVLCIDKTGTLTEPSLTVGEVEALGATASGSPAAPAGDGQAASGSPAGGSGSLGGLEAPLGALAAAERNATALAIAQRFPAPAGWTPRERVAFSSARKWSGADFGEHGAWVLGAPEVLLAPVPGGSAAAETVSRGVAAPAPLADARERAAALAASGARVLVLARAATPLSADTSPRGLAPVALVSLAERVRPDAAETLRFFAGQGVRVLVLSGDATATAAAVARRVGIDPGASADARELPERDEDLIALMERGNVFGRVTPRGKRRMVAALQAAGHTVAMTGDGVNDVLALKAADLGIAMGSGAGAARAVAQTVLLDGRFSTLPGVVAEGRRVMANMERVANLFLVKTAWAVTLALATAAFRVAYPLLPRHITLIDALTIGIPAFVLAFVPNAARYRPGFVRRVLRFALPVGAAIALSVFGGYRVALATGMPLAQARTIATLAMTLAGFGVLSALARPRRGVVLAVLLAMPLALVGVLALPFARAFFAIEPLSGTGIALTALASAAAIGLTVALQAGVARPRPE